MINRESNDRKKKKKSVLGALNEIECLVRDTTPKTFTPKRKREILRKVKEAQRASDAMERSLKTSVKILMNCQGDIPEDSDPWG